MMRLIKVLLLIVVFIAGLLFFIQNSEVLNKPMSLNFNLYVNDLSWTSAERPFFLTVLAAFGVGALFASIMFFIDRVRLGCTVMSLKRSVRSLRQENERLTAQVSKEAKVMLAKSTEVKELPHQDVTQGSAAKPA